jgi:hypothetical protein
VEQSKFDDYYEFEVGMGVQRGDPNNNTNDGVMSDNTSKETEESSLGISSSGSSSSEYSHFFITRPMEEGVMPLASNGFVRFSDVRGESGTRVTIQLSQRAIEAGMLDEENVLKPMLVKFFETSQYSVAFSSYNNGVVVHHEEEEEEEVQSIIDASQRELEDQMEEAAAAAKEGSDDNESILGDLIHHHDNSNNIQGGTSSLLLLARISIVHIFSNIYHVVP